MNIYMKSYQTNHDVRDHMPASARRLNNATVYALNVPACVQGAPGNNGAYYVNSLGNMFIIADGDVTYTGKFDRVQNYQIEKFRQAQANARQLNDEFEEKRTMKVTANSVEEHKYAVYAQVYGAYKLAEDGFNTLADAQEWSVEEYGNSSVWIQKYTGLPPAEVFPETSS